MKPIERFGVLLYNYYVIKKVGKEKAMTTIILIRHGQSMANLNKVFAGHFNAPLSPLGHKQAELTAKAVAERFPDIDKIYASDLLRAYDTGKHLAEILNMEIIPDKAFREIYAGKWEGMKFDDILENYADAFGVWRTDIGNARCTGGESARELGARLFSRIKEIAVENDGKTVVVVTHAAAIRSLMAQCPEENFDGMKDIPFVSNASYSVLSADNGRFEFTEVSCDDHLADLKTALPANV